MTSADHFSQSKRIPLSVLVRAFERNNYLIEKALHILSVEDPESTHTEAGAVSDLLNHWLVNRELGYYINGQRGDDFTALTVVPVNGDYGKGLAAMEAWIVIDKQELVELLRSRGFIVPDNLLNAKADRTPNWNKWRLMCKLTPWQCAALWANIDPDKVRPSRYGGGFDESQEFKDRLDLVQANLYGALKSKNGKVDLRLFAAWVRETGWDAPAELLAMADDHNRTPSDRRTSGATATREARKAGRLGDLKRFIEDVCKALDKDGHEIRESGGRKRLPLSAEDLHTLFCVRHREHQVAQSTFDDDLGTIVTLKPGPKRYEINQLAEMLAGKFSVD